MTTPTLTKKQEEFLEECQLEFSDKYTDVDNDYRKTYENGVPAPPLIYPWYSRSRGNFNRDRGGRSNSRSGYHDRDNYNNRGYGYERRNYGNERRGEAPYEDSRSRYGSSNRRYQPY